MERHCKCSNCYIVVPTGPKGETDTIEVRNTITVDPSQDARVIDTYSAGKHILEKGIYKLNIIFQVLLRMIRRFY